MSDTQLPPAAKAGTGTIDGACLRAGDAAKHLGPPTRLDIPLYSNLFQTRCGLSALDGSWSPQMLLEDDDYWCPDCLTQAGIPFALREDE